MALKTEYWFGHLRVASEAKGDGCVVRWMWLIGAEGAVCGWCGRVDCYRVAVWSKLLRF